MKKIKISLACAALITLCACTSTNLPKDGPPARKVAFAKIPNAVPTVLRESKYGNPPSYSVDGHTYHVRRSDKGFHERGIASWYGTKFHGQLTSTRVPYDMFAMTAAMRTIPIPAFVEVTNLSNGRHVIVEVDDRGPFADNRIIDLSYAAAGKLDMLKKGTALVEVRVIDPRTWDKRMERKTLIEKPKLAHPGKPQLYIQVGAFDDHVNATKLMKKLNKMILQPTRMENAREHGEEIYRVQIGPLKTVDISDIVTRRLKKLGFEHTMAVIE